MLIKTIKATAGHPAQINGCRSKAANRNTLSDEAFKYLQGSVRLIQISIWEAGNEAGVLYLLFFTYLYRFGVKRSAASPFCKEHFIKKGIKHSPQYHFSIVFQTDGYTTDRNAMCKVHRSINWVNDPFILRVLENLPSFLA